MNNYLPSAHRGLFSLYSLALVSFFSIAIVMAIIIINVGFLVSDSQKQVVISALEEVDEHLIIVGKITGTSDVNSNKLITIAIPVRTVSDGAINVDPKIVDVSFTVEKFHNNTISYENIFVGNLNNYTFNSVFDAVAEAKKQGLIDVNPHIDQQGPNKTSAFVYWVINNNFDQRIDENELASLTIVFAEKDRPSTGESMFIQANVKEGYILKFERVIPNITNSIMNFGGKLNNP